MLKSTFKYCDSQGEFEAESPDYHNYPGQNRQRARAKPSVTGAESVPWLTGAVRRGCTCAAGAVSTYARQDPTGGGPPYRVLRGETPQEHGIYLGEISFTDKIVVTHVTQIRPPRILLLQRVLPCVALAGALVASEDDLWPMVRGSVPSAVPPKHSISAQSVQRSASRTTRGSFLERIQWRLSTENPGFLTQGAVWPPWCSFGCGLWLQPLVAGDARCLAIGDRYVDRHHRRPI